MNIVFRQAEINRLEVTLSGPHTQIDLENLSLKLLREAAGLQFGFAMKVDARELFMDDPITNMLWANVFRSLRWFEISYIEHQCRIQSLDRQVHILYGITGFLCSTPIRLDPQ